MFNRREIDIGSQLNTDAGRDLLLIENKLDAGEQLDLAGSYREEVGIPIENGLTVLTLLVSPEACAAAHPEFGKGLAKGLG